ncbi:MAG TPA: hypothetical protein PLC65_01935, partial [Bacteroidia bacterium]|nr:hypothetical protein [Bacteroidia bacterium]
MTRLIYLLVFVFLSALTNAQITYGKITYERKTNLYKRFKDDNVKNWIKEEDKIKLDYFELYFNDTCSAFRPQESE